MNKKIIIAILSALTLTSCGLKIEEKSQKQEVSTSNKSKQDKMTDENNSEKKDSNKNEANLSGNQTESGNTNFSDINALNTIIKDIENLENLLDNDAFDNDIEFERTKDEIENRYELIVKKYNIDDDGLRNENVKMPIEEFKNLENIKEDYSKLLNNYKQKHKR